MKGQVESLSASNDNGGTLLRLVEMVGMRGTRSPLALGLLLRAGEPINPYVA